MAAPRKLARSKGWCPAYAEPCWGMQMEIPAQAFRLTGTIGKVAIRADDATCLLVAKTWKTLTRALRVNARIKKRCKYEAQNRSDPTFPSRCASVGGNPRGTGSGIVVWNLEDEPREIQVQPGPDSE